MPARAPGASGECATTSSPPAPSATCSGSAWSGVAGGVARSRAPAHAAGRAGTSSAKRPRPSSPFRRPPPPHATCRRRAPRRARPRAPPRCGPRARRPRGGGAPREQVAAVRAQQLAVERPAHDEPPLGVRHGAPPASAGAPPASAGAPPASAGAARAPAGAAGGSRKSSSTSAAGGGGGAHAVEVISCQPSHGSNAWNRAAGSHRAARAATRGSARTTIEPPRSIAARRGAQRPPRAGRSSPASAAAAAASASRAAARGASAALARVGPRARALGRDVGEARAAAAGDAVPRGAEAVAARVEAQQVGGLEVREHAQRRPDAREQPPERGRAHAHALQPPARVAPAGALQVRFRSSHRGRGRRARGDSSFLVF